MEYIEPEVINQDLLELKVQLQLEDDTEDHGHIEEVQKMLNMHGLAAVSC